jgi:U2 small nuclear ribonucleoprotein A'
MSALSILNDINAGAQKGKLTADVILESEQALNACGEYELNLSRLEIKYVENLGITNDQFDTIDFSKNSITKLGEGFPKLKRLKTLILTDNKIERINGEALGATVPNLEWIVMQNNKIRNLCDIDELAHAKKLKALVLKGNPVCAVENYRQYCVYKLNDGLKMLDYEKIYEHDRVEARKVFGGEGGEQRTKELKAKTFTAGDVVKDDDNDKNESINKRRKKNTDEAELAKIRAAIANAQTLEEIALLEKAMETGVMPSEYK